MALSVRPIFEMAADAFTTSVSRERFQRNFINGFNRALDKLTIAGDMSTALPHIADTDDSVSSLDEKHADIVYRVLVPILMGMGQQYKDGDAFFTFAVQDAREAEGDFMVSKSQEDQDDQDSDGNIENDIIGHGYIDV